MIRKRVRIRDYEILDSRQNLREMKNQKIYLYGASLTGKKTLEKLQKAGYTVTGFVDGDSDKWDTCWKGIPVLSPKEFKKVDSMNEICLVITSHFVTEIIVELKMLEILPAKVYTSWAIQMALFFAGIEGSDFLSKEFVKLCQSAEQLLESNRYLELGVSGNNMTDLEFLMLLEDSSNVFVFQPCKVGSSSIDYSLNRIGIPSFHFHSFVNHVQQDRREKKEKVTLRKELLKNKKIRIITGVREPISHDISLYFQFLESIVWKDCTTYETLQDACMNFIKKYCWLPSEYTENQYTWLDELTTNRKYGMEFDWFDSMIKEYFGLDIYEYPFDSEKGYSVIRTEQVEIFVYQMEQLSNLEKEIADFVGNSEFHLINTNVASEKPYEYVYKEFLANFKCPKEYFDFYYKENKYMNHFYSDEQKNKFSRKWISN